MKICICNDFNDQTVKKVLESKNPATIIVKNLEEIYKECANGASPVCRRCFPALKDKIAEHGNSLPSKAFPSVPPPV